MTQQRRQTIKRYYSENKARYKINAMNYRRTTQNNRIKLKMEFGGKCSMCGYNRCLANLHFHHKDERTKSFTIGQTTCSYETLKKEAEKCILVCANCHGEIEMEKKAA